MAQEFVGFKIAYSVIRFYAAACEIMNFEFQAFMIFRSYICAGPASKQHRA